MIRNGLVALAKRIEELVGSGHKCFIVYTNNPYRETKTDNKATNKSFIQVLNVATDRTQRNARRLAAYGARNDGSFEEIALFPTMVSLNWIVPLNAGADTLFDYFPKIQAVVNKGVLNFTLQVEVGDNLKAVSVKVATQGDDIDVNAIMGDISEDDIPELQIPIEMSNIFSIYGSKTVPALSDIIIDVDDGSETIEVKHQ